MRLCWTRSPCEVGFRTPYWLHILSVELRNPEPSLLFYCSLHLSLLPQVAERWKGLFPHASKDLMVWAVGHLYLLFKSSQLRALRILQDQKKNRNHNIFLSFRKWEEKKIHSSANPALSPVLLILVWMSASAAFLILIYSRWLSLALLTIYF